MKRPNRNEYVESNAVHKPPPPRRRRPPPAEDEAPSPSGRKCMPLSPLSPARELSTGISPLSRGDSNIERPPPGPITSKGGMNVYCIGRLFMLCKGREEPQSKRRNLATRTTPVFGSCDSSPCHHPHQPGLFTGVAAIGSQP
jgi:hypothetical protein